MKTVLLLSTIMALAPRAWAERPFGTGGPCTLEPGRVQVEASAVDYAREKNNPDHDHTRAESWSVLPFTVRVGLTAATELQVGLEPLRVERVKDRLTGVTSTERGVGDLTLGAKVNLSGNDDETTPAWGILAYVKLPTADHALGNGRVEGGVAVPMTVDLGTSWSLDWESELGVVRNDANTSHRAAWSNCVALNRTVNDLLELSLAIDMGVGEGKPTLAVGPGCTLAVCEDCEVAVGVAFGITRASDDIGAVVDIAWRF